MVTIVYHKDGSIKRVHGALCDYTLNFVITEVLPITNNPQRLCSHDIGGQICQPEPCPECEGEVELDSTTTTGELIDCDDCGVEVVGLDPVQLDVAEFFLDDEDEDDFD